MSETGASRARATTRLSSLRAAVRARSIRAEPSVLPGRTKPRSGMRSLEGDYLLGQGLLVPGLDGIGEGRLDRGDLAARAHEVALEGSQGLDRLRQAGGKAGEAQEGGELVDLAADFDSGIVLADALAGPEVRRCRRRPSWS